LRVFRDYDAAAETGSVSSQENIVTPVKRKVEVLTTPKVDFPLTPPATVKSETVSLDLQIETDGITTRVQEHFVRRSKRRKVTGTIEDPFGEI
jgi:hypothetical protein